jgi:hypothetical protein
MLRTGYIFSQEDIFEFQGGYICFLKFISWEIIFKIFLCLFIFRKIG